MHWDPLPSLPIHLLRWGRGHPNPHQALALFSGRRDGGGRALRCAVRPPRPGLPTLGFHRDSSPAESAPIPAVLASRLWSCLGWLSPWVWGCAPSFQRNLGMRKAGLGFGGTYAFDPLPPGLKKKAPAWNCAWYFTLGRPGFWKVTLLCTAKQCHAVDPPRCR